MNRDKIALIPAAPQDRIRVYEWLTRSDLTSSMVGPPDFPDHPVPSWEEFCEDYADYFFDGSEPYKGRSFLIEYGDVTAGHINYAYDEKEHVAELAEG